MPSVLPGCEELCDNVNARNMVTSGINTGFNFAASSYNETLALLRAVNEFEVTAVDVNLRFRDDFSDISPFAKPVVPTSPDNTIVVGAAPSTLDLDTVDYDPTNPPSAPAEVSPQTPEAPELSDPREPGAAPRVTPPTYPDDPVLTIPTPPTLRELALPDAPTLDIQTILDEFDDLRDRVPVIDPSWLEDLSIDIPSYIENQYALVKARSDEMIAENPAYQQTENTVLSMLTNISANGLPVAIEQQMYDRAVAREDESSYRAEQEVFLDFSRRGYTIPPGPMFGRLQDIYNSNRQARQNINRDIYIENAKIKVEDLRFAISQGVALEAMYRQHFIQIHEQAQVITRLAFEYSANLLNSRIVYFDASVRAWQTEAEIFKSRIELELSKLEQYRLELEAQRIVNEINALDVQIFTQRVEAVKAEAEVYRTQVQAVSEKLRSDEIQIQAYLAEVQAFVAKIQANESRVSAYAEAVRAESLRAQIYESDIRRYEARIRAYSSENETLRDSARLTLDTNRQRIDEFLAQTETYRVQLQAEATRVRANSDLYSGQATMYSAELGAEAARVQADQRGFQLNLEEGRARADLLLGQAQINVDQMLRSTGITVSNMQAALQAMSTLTANALNTVNFSTNYGHSSSKNDQRQHSELHTFQET